MDAMDVMRGLEKAGAVLTDRHFVYKSGKHGSAYVNCDAVYPEAGVIIPICRELRKPFGLETFDVLASPAVGGVALAAYTAADLAFRAGGWNIKAVWADKRGDDFVFERATFADRLRGRRVLVLEDLLTTGGSVIKVCREVERCGGTVIGVSAICNRGGVTAEQLGVPILHSLAEVNLTAINAEDCPLCAEGRPIVEDIGHGETYKEAHPDYRGGYIKLLGR